MTNIQNLSKFSLLLRNIINIGSSDYANMFSIGDCFFPLFLNFIMFTVGWIVSIFTNNVTMLDCFWGVSLAVQSSYYFIQSTVYSSSLSVHKLLFSLLVFINGIRLGVYIIIRQYDKPEDKRYKAIRDYIGKSFRFLSYFIVFIPQLLINNILGIAILQFNSADGVIYKNSIYMIGISMMFFGTLIQSLGDHQLHTYKQRGGKGIFDRGLWSITRHPNYLGDIINWWGIYICNLSAGIYYTIFAPVLFTICVLFITGVTLTEYYMKKKGQVFIDYAERVPILIPWTGLKKIKLD